MSYVFENNSNSNKADIEERCFKPITLSGLFLGFIALLRG
jgi:hypothetical protein